MSPWPRAALLVATSQKPAAWLCVAVITITGATACAGEEDDTQAQGASICRDYETVMRGTMTGTTTDAALARDLDALQDRASELGDSRLTFAIGMMLNPVTRQLEGVDTILRMHERVTLECKFYGVNVLGG